MEKLEKLGINFDVFASVDKSADRQQVIHRESTSVGNSEGFAPASTAKFSTNPPTLLRRLMNT